MWKDGERNEHNTGYAAYIGTKRIVWGLEEQIVIDLAKEALKKQPTKNRFVPTVTIFNCSEIYVIGVITDDANGIKFNRFKRGEVEVYC